MVVFEALVKNSENGGWFIELKDTLDGKVVVCSDLKVFETKIHLTWGKLTILTQN